MNLKLAMLRLLLCLSLARGQWLSFPFKAPQWYDGIPGLRVFGPEDAKEANRFLEDHYQKYKHEEFSAHRQAILLKRGNYDFSFQVPFYTSIAGVGNHPEEVTVRSFNVESRLPWDQGGATKTFWRSVEGLSARETCLWATSQACPIRRSILHKDLNLSGTWENETKMGPSSGGFVAGVVVKGTVNLGTQQQFLFRSCSLGAVKKQTNAYNVVYVGVEGAPAIEEVNAPQMASVVALERVAEKPFLVEDGQWSVVVPAMSSATGTIFEEAKRIPLTDMYIAKAGDTGVSINVGIQGKKGLLLCPAIYETTEPIIVRQDGFVILGLGFPTLLSLGSTPAIIQLADDVRIAGVLLEGGALASTPSTDALLSWQGRGGVASDLFARLGSFKYQTPFHMPCQAMRADVFVQLDGDEVVMDHTWLWHADHDDCSRRWPNSYSASTCKSRTALVVKGRDVIVYGLQAEHTNEDQVQWAGEGGKVFFYQNELPYINPYFHEGFNFGSRYVSYRVTAQRHYAIGLGSYIISIQGHSYVTDVTPFVVPESAEMRNAFVWHITSKTRTPYFRNIYCRGEHCLPCSEATCGDYSQESNMGFVWDFQQHMVVFREA